eukprot:EC720494.1.p1 GENE.EC720494.1~~EC720494.1.p1  ORF type:complete len:66 (+),score=10.91 EC720494.1:92-289(+)
MSRPSADFHAVADQSAGFISHEVKLTDTLEGISLKYGVPIAEIKKANRLFSNAIHGLVTLKIPIE